MHLLGAGSLQTIVVKNLPGGRPSSIRIRWPKQHICGLTACASRRKDTGSSSRRPRRGSAYDGNESTNSDADGDTEDDEEGGQQAKYSDLVYGTLDYGIGDETDSDAAAIAEFVRAKQLAAMRRARLNAAADASAAAQARNAGLQDYFATQGLGSISQFRELAEQEAQRTMEELKEADLAALEAEIAAEGGNLEADWVALESTRSTTGLAKSPAGVRPGRGTGAPLPEDTLLAPPSNPRVEWLRSQTQQMRRKRRLFEPVDGDGSLYDDPLSGSGSDDDAGTAAYDYRPQSSPDASRALSRWATGRTGTGGDTAASRPSQPTLPPKVNPFLSLPKRPSDAFDPSNDVEAILDRMMASDLAAAQQQLQGEDGDIDEDDERYDDEGFDEYGNRRPGAADPGTAANDEYADRMLRALRGALTDKSDLGDGVEALAARPTRPGSASSTRKSQTTAAGTSKASKQLLSAAPDDYDALAELLEAVGGELEQQVVDSVLDDGDDEGMAASPGRKRPLTTTELLRSQIPPPRGTPGSASAPPQLLSRPTAAGPVEVRSPRGARPASGSSSSSSVISGQSAFADDDAHLLEELLSGDSFPSNLAAEEGGVQRSQSLDDLLLGGDGDGDWSQPPAASGSRLPSLESKPTPRNRTGGASPAVASTANSSSSSPGKGRGPGGSDKIRASRTASLTLARRDQEELLRDDWDADLYSLDEQIGDLGTGTQDGGEAWLLSSPESSRSGGFGVADAKPAPQLLARPSKQAAGNVGSGAGTGRSSARMVGKARTSAAAALGEKDLEEMLRGLSELDGEGAKQEELGDGDLEVVSLGVGSTASPPPVTQLARPMRGPSYGGTDGGNASTSTTSKRSDITQSKRVRGGILPGASSESSVMTARGPPTGAQMLPPSLTGPSTGPQEGSPGRDPNSKSSASAAASLEDALAVLASPKRAAALARLEGKPLLSAPPPRQGTSTAANDSTINNIRTKSSSSSSSATSSIPASLSQTTGNQRTSEPPNPPQRGVTTGAQEPPASQQQQQPEQSPKKNKSSRTSAGSSSGSPAAPEPVAASGPTSAQATMEAVSDTQAKSSKELAAATATLLDAGKAAKLRSFRRVPAGTEGPIEAVPPARTMAGSLSPSSPSSSQSLSSVPPMSSSSSTSSATTAALESTIAAVLPHPVPNPAGPSTGNISRITDRDGAAATEGASAPAKVRSFTRSPAVRPWRPGRTPLPVPSAAEPFPTAATAPSQSTTANGPPSINAGMRNDPADAADGPPKAAALPATPPAPFRGTSPAATSRQQRGRLWDPALQLDAPPASRPGSTVDLNASVGSTASLPHGRDGIPTSTSPSAPMSFSDRLRRVRLMVMRGELVEGFVDANFDVSKHQGVAALFPRLASLGVAQPVWIWADGLLGWRCKRVAETQTTAASAGTQVQDTPTGSRNSMGTQSGASQDSVAAEPVGGGGGPDRGKVMTSQPYKRIWAAVTSVRALSEDEARFLGMWTTNGVAEGGAAAAAAAAAAARVRGGGTLTDNVPADLSVQAVEVLAPASQRWNSLSHSIRRQVLDLNHGRMVSAKVLALTERGAYCEVKMEAPRLLLAKGAAEAAVAGREGKLTDGAAARASATPSSPALLSSAGEGAGEAAAAATAEEMGRPGVALYSQLCFLPVESMAGALAADWPQTVHADKDERVRALARATGDFVSLMSARSRTIRTSWTRIMRPGDVVECRVEGGVVTPVSVLLGLLSQNTHRASTGLLEALDLASTRSETTAPHVGATYMSGIAMAAMGTEVELPVGVWRLQSAAEENVIDKGRNDTAGAAQVAVPAGMEADYDEAAASSGILMDDTAARVSAILGAAPLPSEVDGGADHATAAARMQSGSIHASRPAVLAFEVNWMNQHGPTDKAGATVLEVSSTHEHVGYVSPGDRPTPSLSSGLGFPGTTPRGALVPVDGSAQLPGSEPPPLERVLAASWVPLPRGGRSALVREPLGIRSESNSCPETPDSPPACAFPALAKPPSPNGPRVGSALASSSPVPPLRHDSWSHQDAATSSSPPPSPLQLSRPPPRSPRPWIHKTPHAPPDLASVGDRNAIADDGVNTYADADVGSAVTGAYASGTMQATWSWDPALKLNAPTSSWSAGAAATIVGAAIGANGFEDATLPGARSFPPTMQFMDRLKRVRLIVMRGDLVEGYLQGPYDFTRHAVAAVFPGLSKLGVTQPVWIPAGHLLNWRKDLIGECGADGAAAAAAVNAGGDAASASSAPLGAPAGAEEQGEQGEDVTALGDQGRSRGSVPPGRPSRPTKRIWVAVTSVRAAGQNTEEETSSKRQSHAAVAVPEAQDGPLPAVAASAEPPAAAAPAAAGTAACPGVEHVPADLVVQVQEVTAPWAQRWTSGFATARRQVVASNRGRQVDTHVLAITERGVYCELQLEAPGRPGDNPRGFKGAPPLAPEGKSTVMSVTGASVAGGAEPDAKLEAPQVPEAVDTQLVIHHQLAFVPRESLAAPLAAGWADMVAVDKNFRARAVARSVGDNALLAELNQASHRVDLRAERMRMGDVLVAIVDFAVVCVAIPQFLVMAVLRQVPHRVSGELLRALDIAVPVELASVPTTSAADGASAAGQGDRGGGGCSS
ncbi:hypothetical protein Vretimale_1584 [Volvox reticuliferus]|uniref:Uncharacterized protein n=1 Tax=Volvox reticuliferus TaxID=1737510 RepID=A0A8J4CFL0_9CHLO|nr:hypothetical protein Vretifemale_10987 [Volvox reticuliferus]GIL95596.1 hypothetical protein Vretimale_1584 [Volvox reticuliferus]